MSMKSIEEIRETPPIPKSVIWAHISEHLRPPEGEDIHTPVCVETPASIIAIDLKGFTEFCGQHPSDRVMEILNIAFSEAIEESIVTTNNITPSIIGFLGDELRILVTGSEYEEGSIILAKRIKTAVERIMKKHSVPLGLHVGVAVGTNRRTIVGLPGNYIEVNSSPAHFAVEKLKGGEDVLVEHIETPSDDNRASETNLTTSMEDFIPCNDIVFKDLSEADVAEMLPRGTRTIEGHVLREAPVIMMHIKNFSEIEEQLCDASLDTWHHYFDTLVCNIQNILDEYGGRIQNIASGRICIIFGTDQSADIMHKSINNAISACYALEGALREQNEQNDSPWVWSMALSAGEAYYGLNGNTNRLSANIISGAVNTAARWAVTAEPESMLIPLDTLEENTQIRARERIRATLKGLAGKQEATELKDIRDILASGVVPKKIIFAPEWSDRHLDSQFLSTEKPITVVSGPAGHSKTCFIKHCENQDVRRDYHDISLSYFHMQMPYGPVIQLIKRMLDRDRNGIVEAEEVDAMFPMDSPENGTIRFLLGLPTDTDKAEQHDIVKVLNQLGESLHGSHLFIFHSAQYIDETNIQAFIDLAFEHPKHIQFAFEYDTDELAEQSGSILKRVRGESFVESIELDQLVSQETYIQIAIQELTNDPFLNADNISPDIISFITRLHNSNANLRVLSKTCSILKNYITRSGMMYRFSHGISEGELMRITSGSINVQLHQIERQAPKSLLKTTRLLALIGPQFRVSVAAKVLGEETINAVIQNRELCSMCDIEFSEMGEIIFRNDGLRQGLIDGVESDEASNTHSKITDVLKEDIHNRSDSAIAYHHWQQFMRKPPFNQVEFSETQRKLAYDLFRYGRRSFFQTASSMYQITQTLNRAFCCSFEPSFSSDEDRWQSLQALSGAEERELCFILGACLLRRGDDSFEDADLEKLGLSSPSITDVFNRGRSEVTIDDSPEEIFWLLKNQCGMFQYYIHTRYSAEEIVRPEIIDELEREFDEVNAVIERNCQKLQSMGAETYVLISELKRIEAKLCELQGQHVSAIFVEKDALERLEKALKNPENTTHDFHVLEYERVKTLLNLSYLYAEQEDPDLPKSIELSLRALRILDTLEIDASPHGYLTRVEALNNLAYSYAENEQCTEAMKSLHAAIELSHSRGLFYYSEDALRENCEEILEMISDILQTKGFVPRDFDTDLFEKIRSIAEQYGVPESILKTASEAASLEPEDY